MQFHAVVHIRDEALTSIMSICSLHIYALCDRNDSNFKNNAYDFVISTARANEGGAITQA